MHFSKSYEKLLLTLPADLRGSTIEYGQLKKLIRELINELASLGLEPAGLQEHLERADPGLHAKARECVDACGLRQLFLKSPLKPPKLVYEFSVDIKPRLRLRFKDAGSYARDESTPNCDNDPSSFIHLEPESGVTYHLSESTTEIRLNLSSPEPVYVPVSTNDSQVLNIGPAKMGQVPACLQSEATREDIIINLVSDTIFFQLLSDGIRALSAQLVAVHPQFIATLENLSRSISLAARPVSLMSSSRPAWSQALSASPTSLFSIRKSDLYAWREMFEIYLEAEIFESIREPGRGERTVEESERRLRAFAERIMQNGLGDKRTFKMQQSQAALETFLELNIFVFNLKKLSHANAEATRKILKKHAKRTGLPLSVSIDDALSSSSSKHAPTAQFSTDLFIIPKATASSHRILIQAIGEVLLPLIPRLNDYECLICTSIAFIPIRLACGHFFCVRCLVKMQKRGQGNCPMCRAPVVLTADRSNVDSALYNFMQDWFPVETRIKRRQNEREAGEESLREMGLSDEGCSIA